MNDDRGAAKAALFGYISQTAKALAHPLRLQIIELLAQRERSVEMLATHLKADVKNVSAQLKILHTARLIESRRVGRRIWYRVKDEHVVHHWQSLCRLAEDCALEVDRLLESYASDPDSLSPLDRKSLLAAARKGEVMILDVRPVDEYDCAHLPHAVSIPLDELERRLRSIRKNIEIVAYCRGPYCLLSVDAVRLLKEHGYSAHRIHDGVNEWLQAGFPLERPAS